MKKTAALIACLCLLSAAAAPSQTAPEDWENPALLHAGTERPRATFVPVPGRGFGAPDSAPKNRPAIFRSTARGNSTGRRGRPTGPSISGNPGRMSAAGKRRPFRRTGCSRATTIRSMSTSLMNSPAIPNRRSCRTIAIPSAPTAARSPSRRSGRDGGLPPLRRRQVRSSTSGSTAKSRLQQGLEDAGRIRHHARSSCPARTSWPSRSTAGRTAPISSARTSGG